MTLDILAQPPRRPKLFLAQQRQLIDVVFRSRL
jgi:hypothetical protein